MDIPLIPSNLWCCRVRGRRSFDVSGSQEVSDATDIHQDIHRPCSGHGCLGRMLHIGLEVSRGYNGSAMLVPSVQAAENVRTECEQEKK